MNVFQAIATALLAGGIARDWFQRSAKSTLAIRMSRTAIWGLAMVAILNPDWVTRFANVFGIGRGADIILYLVTLAFIAVTFFFYAQQLRMRRELSKVVGHLARSEPRFGGGMPSEAGDSPFAGSGR